MISNETEILLIEDNDIDILFIKKVLESKKYNFELTTSKSLKNSLKLLRNKRFDLIFLDLHLPDSEGLNSLKELTNENISSPIIVLTSTIDEQLAIDCIRNGASDYLIKGQVTNVQIPTSIYVTLEKIQKEKKLLEKSLIDDLTNLYNRRGLKHFFEQFKSLSKREHKNLNVFFIDINHMKMINDNFGHSEGDKTIVFISHLLKKTFREVDLISRIGGDEFIILALGNFQENEIIERLKDSLKVRNENNSLYRITISIGLLTLKNDNLNFSLKKMLKVSDEALYNAKKSKSKYDVSLFTIKN